jgi:hypothetical protein
VKPATRWRIAFLGLTAVVLGLEIWASADGNPNTDPWTDLLVRHVPAEIMFAAIGALSLWLGIHFGVRYIRKAKERRTDNIEGG